MARFDLGGRPPDTAINIEWDFGDGAVDQGQTTAHAYSQPGTYTVTVTLNVLAGFQSATASTTATISGGQIPGRLTVNAGGPYTGQVGQPVFFMARFDLGGRPPDAIRLDWDFGDGAADMGQTTSHTYSQPGTFRVTVTLTDLGSGETAIASTTAQISSTPVVPRTASAGGPYSGTAGQAITMTGSITPAGPVQDWIWTFGDGTSGSGQSVQKTYNQPGTFTVTLEVRPVNQATVVATTTATVGTAPSQPEQVPLPSGCSNQALTWPVGTPIATVAAAVSPPSALLSIFRLDLAQGRFLGFSPTAPSFANDYTMVGSSLEAVFFCLSAPGTLFRPDPGGSSMPLPRLVGPVHRWQGTLLNDGQQFTPADPSLYTLQLFPDGTGAAQVDCNRAVGSYSVSDNRLTLSIMASTRAACPPGSLGDVYQRQLNSVSSFFFQDGQLFLEIMFDSGSMRFTTQ